MRIRCKPSALALTVIALVLTTAACHASIRASKAEMKAKRSWLNDRLLNAQPSLPFSFVYDGRHSDELLGSWRRTTGFRRLNNGRTERTITWTDPKTSLTVRCVSTEYSDYPVLEWTVYLKNAGSANTPIIESIQGLDVRLERRSSEPEFVLRGNKGDFCTYDSYEPFTHTMGPSFTKKFAPPDYSGKSCDGPDGWPYWNLQTPGGGVIIACGWPGQWQSSFTRDEGNGLRVLAGQQLTHMYLKPGEEIRTPLIATLHWRGNNVVRAQNLWRRWYMKHVIPHVDGKPQPINHVIGGPGEMEELPDVDAFAKAGIEVDMYWRDAGVEWRKLWYPVPDGPFKEGAWWLNTGTWVPDPERYPNGFAQFSDEMRKRGYLFMLWFEVERVGSPDSWLGKNHPDWLLSGTDTTAGAILDEGNPEAWQWLVDHIDGMIKSQKLDWYREDMNGGGPAAAWRKNDTPDRQGFTENRYVQGHLAFWDEIKRRNPGLGIDSCASGGRRNDLETMKRAVPLLRSDFQAPSAPKVIEGNQGHTYGIASWLPWYGSGVIGRESYRARSFMMPGFVESCPPGWWKSPLFKADVQRNYGEARKIGPLMLGDYYPLTEYSLDLDKWMAWQFDRPEQGDGCVQAFRRENCESATVTYRLNGLSSKAIYEITDFDKPNEKQRLSGRHLMTKGLTINIQDKPGAAIITYKKVK